MKLYMHVGACSLSPHIVCRELGIPVEIVEVDRKTHLTPSGEDFRKVNGNGYVPVLILEDGTIITEGPAIVQYLGDQRPDADLLPRAGTMERTHVQSWLNFITSELHKPMVMLFQPAYQPAKTALLDHVDKRLDWLSGELSGPYLTGKTFTVADAYLFVCLNWSPWINIDLKRRPVLEAFMTRTGERPRVQEALAVEGLVPYGEGSVFFAPAGSAGATSGGREGVKP